MQYVQAQPAVKPQPVQMTMANGSTFIKGADGEYKVVIGRTPPPMAGSAGPMQGSAPPQPVVATTIAGQQMQMMPVGGMALSPAECQQLGVPYGTRWGASRPSSGSARPYAPEGQWDQPQDLSGTQV